MLNYSLNKEKSAESSGHVTCLLSQRATTRATTMEKDVACVCDTVRAADKDNNHQLLKVLC